MGNKIGKFKRRTSIINEHICCLPFEKTEEYPPPLKHPTCRRKAKRCWKNAILLYPEHPTTDELFKTKYERIQERKRQYKLFPWIIHPLSRFRAYYEFWLCFLLAAAMIYLPIFTAFCACAKDVGTSTRWDFICYDVMIGALIVDVVITFFTGYIYEENVILIQKKIARHYILSIFFITDVLACCPMSWAKKNSQLIFVLSFFNLVKIIRMPTLLNYVQRTGQFFKLPTKLTGLIRYIVRVFMMLHWAACVLYIVPMCRSQFHGQAHPNSWVNVEVPGLIDKTVWTRYIRSLYKATALIMCIKSQPATFNERNNPDHSDHPPGEEYLLEGVLVMVGKVYIYWITVLILEEILAVRKLQNQYNETLNQVTGYMKQKKIPAEMQGRLKLYYDFKYDRKFFKEAQINELFTDNMKSLINLHACRNFIKSVKLFKNIPEDIMRSILNHLEPEVFLPNDIILKAGTDADCMYFLSTGTVAVYTSAGTEVCHLQDGAYFGEICLILKHKKRTTTVLALEICQLYRLGKKAFRANISKESMLYRNMESAAKERLKDTENLMSRTVMPLFETGN